MRRAYEPVSHAGVKSIYDGAREKLTEGSAERAGGAVGCGAGKYEKALPVCFSCIHGKGFVSCLMDQKIEQTGSVLYLSAERKSEHQAVDIFNIFLIEPDKALDIAGAAVSAGTDPGHFLDVLFFCAELPEV